MDCLEGLKLLDDNCIDLTVTSPPYDDLRNYNGYSFDFENIAKELYRVTKNGGIIVWIVADATNKGSETGTSFKQALFFKEMVEDIIREKQNNILNELYDVFNTKLPSVEEIKEIKASIGDVFSNESPEQLKTIEKILAYNDPTMKTIKDVVMDVNINTELQNVLEKKIEEKENN